MDNKGVLETVIRDGRFKYSDLKEGLNIGRLTLKYRIVERTKTRRYQIKWCCDCSCGTRNIFIYAENLCRKIPTQSCRCLQKECISARSRTHGERGHKERKYTPEYTTWCRIVDRCLNKNSPCYNNYGGRGIRICKRWRNSYELFLEDMGRKPSEKHSIDRIDNDGNYCPENCRWADKKQQARNRRTNRIVIIDGVKKTLIEWSEVSGVSYRVILSRIGRYGWDEKDAIFIKARKNKRRK